MTEKEAISLFERVHTLQEQLKMETDIQDISNILNQRPISMYQVREKIEEVNEEHPENVLLNHIIFPPRGKSFLGGYIPDQNYIDDLTWKQIYLRAKKNGKLFDELCKEMRKASEMY